MLVNPWRFLKRTSCWIGLSVLLSPAFFMACGGGSGDKPAGGTTPTATPTSAPTPTPTPTLDHSIALLAGATNGGYVDGPRADARFNSVTGMAMDAMGNTYLCDTRNHTIRKIDTFGKVSTLAGQAGKSGSQNGKGGEARFNHPRGLSLGVDGNLYVGDAGNNLIRKVALDGTVSSFTIQSVVQMQGDVLVGDDTGNLYTISGSCIYRISPEGLVALIAGSDYGYKDGVGASAQFAYPEDLALDGGILYVADTPNGVIRRISLSDNSVTTLVGQVHDLKVVDGDLVAARFSSPTGICMSADKGLWISDSGVLRKLSAGSVVTVAGQIGVLGHVDGKGSNVLFAGPGKCLRRPDGHLLVSDGYCIRDVDADLNVSTWAGMLQAGYGDGRNTEARFGYLNNVAVDAQGNLYLTDDSSHTIRKIAKDGTVSTVAGIAWKAGHQDGPASQATFNRPWGIVLDQDGNIYVSEYENQTIRKISADQMIVSTLAGVAGERGSLNGRGSEARFFGPTGMAMDGDGNLLVTEDNGSDVRKVTRDGVVSTFAASKDFTFPTGVAVAPDGTVYVSAWPKIHKIATDGTISVLAGSDESGNVDKAGAAARFGMVFSLSVDGSGNLFAADLDNNSIRKITPDGTVSTVVGDGMPGFALGALPGSIFAPNGVVVDDKGTLYVAVLGAVLKVTL